MQHIKTLLLFVFLIFSAEHSFGQRVEVGLNAGGASYLGDLNQYDLAKISGISVGASVKYNIDRNWGIGLYYTYGKVGANDAKSDNEQFVDRNLSFSSPLNELSLMGSFNFFDLFEWGYKKRRITPYIFAGIGLVVFDPKAKFQGNEYQLRLYLTEGQSDPYSNIAVTIPYGAGVKYRLTETLTLSSQIGFRSAQTDYLDDVSGVYPDKNVWADRNAAPISRALSDRSGEQTGIYIGEQNTQRGDFRKRDNYMFVGIGISYTFVSQKCFSF